MRITTRKRLAVLPAATLLALAVGSPAYAVTNWSQGFESHTDGWIELEPAAGIQRVASGYNGIESSAGSNHAVMTAPHMFTRFDSYDAEWDGTWKAAIDVYLDPSWDAGAGFDYSVAANGSDGKHQRDFIVHVTKDTSTGKLLVGASNNTNNAPREDLATLANHAEVTEAGWYTVQHTFRDQDGVLAVDIEVLKGEDVVFKETRTAPEDVMAEIGGNRYGWFTALDGMELAVDNVRIARVAQEAGRSYSTDFTHEAITKANPARWRMSGSYDAAIETIDGDAVLRISNSTTSGSFGDMLYSPRLTVAADERAVDNVFNASFVIEPTEYQEGLVVTASPDNGVGGRNGYLRIKHVNDGVTVEAAGSYLKADGTSDWNYVDVASGLDVGQPHTVHMQTVKRPGKAPEVVDDVFRAWVDNGPQAEVGTFEAYFAETGEPNYATDTLLFRMSGTAAPDFKGAGLLIDDLTMSVSTEKPVEPPVTPPTDPGKPPTTPGNPDPGTPPTTNPGNPDPGTPPVTTPAKSASVKAKAVSGKSKMRINVNPNKGSGFWKVKIQKKTATGWKTLKKTYRTKGRAEILTVDLPKGTYRAKVLPKYGYEKFFSNRVHLKK